MPKRRNKKRLDRLEKVLRRLVEVGQTYKLIDKDGQYVKGGNVGKVIGVSYENGPQLESLTDPAVSRLIPWEEFWDTYGIYREEPKP